MEWQGKLNEAQKKVLSHHTGPMMILAGAGSGKTRTLVSKIISLIKDGNIPPSKILALTFSNKAAKEMRDRIETSLNYGPNGLQVQTFHSFCSRILRTEATYIGLSRTFTIYDASESKAVVKNIMAKYGLSPKEMNPYDILSYIEQLKNAGHYLNRKDDVSNFSNDELYKFFVDYEKEIHQSNALDFGGLISGVLNLFEVHENLRQSYERRYDVILVDEYQDTNLAQFQLLCHLRRDNHNICVVGDEDQSIYSWRGANIRNILDFEKYFNGAKVYKLEQNYRSTKHIIEAASHVIQHNEERKGKVLWTENPDGDLIDIVELGNERDEADYVALQIKRLVGNEFVPPSEIAVFYRTNAQSRLIEESLRRLKLDYRVVGGVKFYERKEIKDLIAYIRLVANPKDSLAFGRIINVPARGIGATSLKKLEVIAGEMGASLYETAQHLLKGQFAEGELKLSKKLQAALSNFVSLIEECIVLMNNSSGPAQIFQKLLYESGYWDFLKANRDYESMSRMENIQEFENAVLHFEKNNPDSSLINFLETITLDSQTDETSSETAKPQEQISLMTIHGAKGLEFSHAFIVGAEEQVFPSYRSLEDGARGIEEERRLFYVAMTRAMKRLCITFAQGRTVFGQFRFNGPSRFLNEIQANHVNWIHLASKQENEEDDDWSSKSQKLGYKKSSDDYSQDLYQESFDDDSYTVASKGINGQKVIHKVYGPGVIVETSGHGNDAKVTIKFRDGIRKKFLIKHSPIEFITS